MDSIVKNFVSTKDELLKAFDCSDLYFVKVQEDCFWRIKNVDGMHFLTYWKEGGKLCECIVVKKDNLPLISRKEGYTMAVIIECVKVALVLKNELEV